MKLDILANTILIDDTIIMFVTICINVKIYTYTKYKIDKNVAISGKQICIEGNTIIAIFELY